MLLRKADIKTLLGTCYERSSRLDAKQPQGSG
jgi:hypothetical protein